RVGVVGPHADALSAALGLRGDPANLPRCEDARAAHLPQHLALLDVAVPQLLAVDPRRGGLELTHADSDGHEKHDAGAREQGLSNSLTPLAFGSWNVHARPNAMTVPALASSSSH